MLIWWTMITVTLRITLLINACRDELNTLSLGLQFNRVLEST